MGFSRRILASACLAVLASGCATFGTNIEGDFTCRAPKGDCAPSQVIDAQQALLWSLSADERMRLDESSAAMSVRMPENPFQSA